MRRSCSLAQRPRGSMRGCVPRLSDPVAPCAAACPGSATRWLHARLRAAAHRQVMVCIASAGARVATAQQRRREVGSSARVATAQQRRREVGSSARVASAQQRRREVGSSARVALAQKRLREVGSSARVALAQKRLREVLPLDGPSTPADGRDHRVHRHHYEQQRQLRHASTQTSPQKPQVLPAKAGCLKHADCKSGACGYAYDSGKKVSCA